MRCPSRHQLLLLLLVAAVIVALLVPADCKKNGAKKSKKAAAKTAQPGDMSAANVQFDRAMKLKQAGQLHEQKEGTGTGREREE